MTKVSLYKAKRATRGDPKRMVWLLRWHGTDGKRYCETVGVVGKMTKRDAERLLRDKQGKLDCGVIRPDKPRRTTLGEFLERDREAIRGDVMPATIVEHQTASQHVLACIDGARRLDAVSRSDVGRLKAHLRDERQLANATVAKTVRTLRAAFNRALADGLIHVNPFAGQARMRTQSKAKRIFEAHEIRALVEAAPDLWWRAFIRLLATTGLRRNEALNLLWSDVDLERKTVTVSRKDSGWFEVDGERYPVLRWQTKTHVERTVPVPDDTLLALQRMKAKSGGSRYVFLSLERLRHIGAVLDQRGLSAKFDLVGGLSARFTSIQAAAEALLQERSSEPIEWPRATLHDLRRTYGTHMARRVPMHVLRQLLGHANISTTADYYLGFTDADAEIARTTMDGLLATTDAQLTRKATSAG